MDSSIKKPMIVHLGEQKVQSEQLDSGLYAKIPDNKKGTQVYGKQLTLVKDNVYMSNCLKEKAIRVKKNLAMGTPPIDDLKTIIQMNSYKDNQVLLKILI